MRRSESAGLPVFPRVDPFCCLVGKIRTKTVGWGVGNLLAAFLIEPPRCSSRGSLIARADTSACPQTHVGAATPPIGYFRPTNSIKPSTGETEGRVAGC